MIPVLTETQAKKFEYKTKNQIRCPKCNKRILDGFMVGETVCTRGNCGHKFMANNLIGLKVIGYGKEGHEIILRLG